MLVRNDRLVSSPASDSGFSLVEVMVAVLIVSVAVSALLYRIMSVVDNTAYLRDKTIAHWVALNQQELLYLENRHSNDLIRGERSGSETIGGREWYWRVTPVQIATRDKNFQQLRISVSDEEGSNSSLVSLNILLDRYHQPRDT